MGLTILFLKMFTNVCKYVHLISNKIFLRRNISVSTQVPILAGGAPRSSSICKAGKLPYNLQCWCDIKNPTTTKKNFLATAGLFV